MSAAILRADKVSKRFGGLKAVDEVDLELAEHEILGVIGPNGAGKTTLFSLIAGSIPPTAGTVYLGDRVISGLPAQKAVHAGVVRTHQIVRPFGNLTVLENVMVGAIYGKRGPAGALDRSLEVIEFVGLADRASDLPPGLTLAGRKRLELARALATEPRVLLLDEVIAGVNPAEALQMAELIRKVREQRGLSIILIEHVMPAVMALSDRVVVLDAGKKIAEGKPQEVVRDAKVIAAYLGESAAKVQKPSEGTQASQTGKGSEAARTAEAARASEAARAAEAAKASEAAKGSEAKPSEAARASEAAKGSEAKTSEAAKPPPRGKPS